MTSVYLDYPTSTVSVHTNSTAEQEFRQDVSERRVVRFTPQSLSQELLPFVNQEVPFFAEAVLGCMWLELDFDDELFELSLAKYVVNLLGKRYEPFRKAAWRGGPILWD
jgi:hypothetical protein